MRTIGRRMFYRTTSFIKIFSQVFTLFKHEHLTLIPISKFILQTFLILLSLNFSFNSIFSFINYLLFQFLSFLYFYISIRFILSPWILFLLYLVLLIILFLFLKKYKLKNKIQFIKWKEDVFIYYYGIFKRRGSIIFRMILD